MNATGKLLSGPRGPRGPIVGISVIVGLLEIRNLSRLIYTHFMGCHSALDIASRIFSMDDAQFIDVTLAVSVIVMLGWAAVSWLRDGTS
jgi:hypothetical protein